MADAHRDEIAKLEALYAEHPEGRVFTHLAEACRKGGDLERAREVLTEGIERHPDYSSAHVVLGRVLMDLGDYDEARAEFRRVLELDHQNLVALRSLGDIAREEGRTEDALEHYHALLDLEPADPEVQDLVSELSDGLVVPGPSEKEEPEAAEAGAEPEPVAEGPEEAPEPMTVGPEEAFETVAEGPEEAFETVAADAAGEEPGEPEAAAEEWTPGAGAEEASSAVEEAAEAEVGAGIGPVGPEQAADIEPLDDEGDDVMTETIAQVYARQGLYDRAADVYRELSRARPDDEGLKERLAEMEAKAAEPGAAPPAEAEPAVEPAVEEAVTDAGGLEGLETEEAEPEELVADEPGGVEGFQSVEFHPEPSDADAAPLEGFEAEDTEFHAPPHGEAQAEVEAEPVEVEEELGAEVEDELTAEVGEELTAEVEEEPAGEAPWAADVEGVAEEAEEEAEPWAAAEAAETEEESDEAEEEPWAGEEEGPWAAAEEAEAGAEGAAEAEGAAGEPEEEPWETEEVADAEPEPAAEAAVGEEPIGEEPAEEEPESPWTAGDWSEEEEPETPYAWAESEGAEDHSAPIGEYLSDVLDWGGRVPAAGGADAPEPGSGPESEPESTAGPGQAPGGPDESPGGPDGEDDDLEMFRSWLESLKQ